MAQNFHSQISQLERYIAGLDRDAANSAKKEADLISKITRA